MATVADSFSLLGIKMDLDEANGRDWELNSKADDVDSDLISFEVRDSSFYLTHFIAFFVASLVCGLCIIQASYSIQPHQVMELLTGEELSEEVFFKYFSSVEHFVWDADHVDLRVNTSLFIL